MFDLFFLPVLANRWISASLKSDPLVHFSIFEHQLSIRKNASCFLRHRWIQATTLQGFISMKFQDLLIPFVFALVGTFAIQYYFFSDKTVVSDIPTADRQFTAPTSLQVAEPLDLEIDFYKETPAREKQETVVNLKHETLTFSNEGAIIDSIGFKRNLGGKLTLLEIVTPSQNKMEGAFLIALDGKGKTPYLYTLVDKKEQEGRTILTYKGSSPAADIVKQFIVHHDLYVIDVRFTITPKTTEPLRARIFFPAPRLAADAVDTTQAVLTKGNYLEKQPVKSVLQVGVEKPTVFGLEDTYFAQVLYKDDDHFSQRGYFKHEGLVSQAVLQSGTIKEPMTWNLSFYSGPKELDSLSKVDPRLEGLLSYGWFAPLCKFLLWILIYLFGLFQNYGLAIIGLTILVRLVLIPFTLHGEKNRRQSLEAQKKLAYLDKRYKDDPEELARSKAEFARKHGVSGVLGCLPGLMQIPVFFGLQRVLTHAIELYKAPFLWINDLSSPDPLYILPIIMAGGLAVQMSQMGDVRQRLANVLIALVIGAVASSFSAGLTLYIAVSTVLGLAQEYIQKAIIR